MARKHHTKHHRSRSRYKERLAARGLNRTPTMTRWDTDLLTAAKRREGKLTALDYLIAQGRVAS